MITDRESIHDQLVEGSLGVDGPCAVERAAVDTYDHDQHNDDRGLRPNDHVPVPATFIY